MYIVICKIQLRTGRQKLKLTYNVIYDIIDSEVGDLLMKIHFRTKKLEKKLSIKRMIKRYYTSLYTGILNRLTELESVPHLGFITHLPPPRRHKLIGEWENCWAVDVSKNHRLIFSSLKKGIINEEDIDEIVIECIEDYH